MSEILRGIRRPRKAIDHVLRNATLPVTSRFCWGTHVLNCDWDLLIILDTCRVDALQAVADEYEFITTVDRIWSVGGTSPEWIAHTFDREWEDVLSKTAYLNVNAWAERVIEERVLSNNVGSDHRGINQMKRYGKWDVISPDQLGHLEHVWKYVDSDSDQWAKTIPEEYIHGRSPPKYLTDRAISVGREKKYDRVILHYTQPHSPYVASAISEGRGLYDYEKNPFEYIQKTGDKNRVFNSYLDELRYVLDSVSILLENFDADKVVISSDHGESFGSYGIYGHHAGSFHPEIRYVPWAVTEASDSRSHQPEITSEKSSDRNIDDALKALGYKV